MIGHVLSREIAEKARLPLAIMKTAHAKKFLCKSRLIHFSAKHIGVHASAYLIIFFVINLQYLYSTSMVFKDKVCKVQQSEGREKKYEAQRTTEN